MPPFVVHSASFVRRFSSSGVHGGTITEKTPLTQPQCQAPVAGCHRSETSRAVYELRGISRGSPRLRQMRDVQRQKRDRTQERQLETFLSSASDRASQARSFCFWCALRYIHTVFPCVNERKPYEQREQDGICIPWTGIADGGNGQGYCCDPCRRSRDV